MGSFKDLTGQKFGRLTAVEHVGTKKGQTMWKCICDCGNTSIIGYPNLITGNTKSCGCLNSETARKALTVHGLYGSRLYHTWRGLRQRCNNPKAKAYPNYGGRGISCCEEWNDFAVFYEWAMHNGYAENLTIDRINNMEGYHPSNCRFSTRKEQANNRRSNLWYEYSGELKNVQQWSDSCGIKYETLSNRLKTGWSIEKAITTPARKKNKPSCRERGAAYGK